MWCKAEEDADTGKLFIFGVAGLRGQSLEDRDGGPSSEPEGPLGPERVLAEAVQDPGELQRTLKA